VTSQDFGPLLDHPAVRALAAASGGTASHLVGGVLRDHVLGLPLHDIDAVVAERGLEIAETLAAELPARLVLLGGKDFAAYRLVGEDATVDLWDRDGTSLHEDLARRDFTVNSIALDARTGEVADPFGGLEDLERRVLRATTGDSFSGDPLRVLRLPRLMLRLPGFTADPETLELARRSSAQLSGVAAERVRDELSFLFDHPEAAQGLALLVSLDVYPGLWIGRPGERGLPDGGTVAELTDLPHRIRAMHQFAPEAADTVNAKAIRLAATFAHLPPSRAGREPADVLAFFRDAGYMTRADATEVSFLLKLGGMPNDETGRRRFLHRTGRRWATAACFLGVGTRYLPGWVADLVLLAAVARREGEHLFDPPRLLTGEEVQALLGVPPGPEVGKALAAVRQAQVDGKVRTREEAERLLLRST
jgi:hypothetical protein